MSAIDLTGVQAVHYESASIVQVMYGGGQVWPAVNFTVTDWGKPTTFAASGSPRSVVVQGAGSSAGASFSIDDMTGDPPTLTVNSWGNILPGDHVVIVFGNDLIFYDNDRVVTLVAN